MTDSDTRRRLEVGKQYERWPYPHVPIFGAVPRHHTWQLHADFWRDRCGLGPGPKRARIWIAGCGTMQPYTFRLANPHAHITATDISERSLDIARRRCLWHGQLDLEFGFADLTDEASCPTGPFDIIECYGVLMNLPDPAAALRLLASRLAPGGVLRVMVYPHYSRRRVFQVQRVARLCRLHFARRADPARLRRLMARLARSHPLRFAFDTYADARNDAGLVDGFLHAGDRGFTGLELGALCEQAGLRPKFWFHREWARPEVMAPRLGLEHTSQFFVAHYLDLWQELRGNFVVCLVRDEPPSPPEAATPRIHPSFRTDFARSPLEWLQRQTWWRVRGIDTPDRLADEPLRLPGVSLRRVRHPARCDASLLAEMSARGVVLGGPAAQSSPKLAAFGGRIDQTQEPRLEVGPKAANPFYQHLFDAWCCGPETSDGWLQTPAAQLAAWQTEAEALENDVCPTGLTPVGSHAAVGEARIAEYRANRCEQPIAASWQDWLPIDERRVRNELDPLLEGIAPVESIARGDLAELWSLLRCPGDLLSD